MTCRIQNIYSGVCHLNVDRSRLSGPRTVQSLQIRTVGDGLHIVRSGWSDCVHRGARVGVNEYRGVCHLNVSLSEIVYQPIEPYRKS